MSTKPLLSPRFYSYAFREARAFLALLLVGGPALYSVEAYFNALNAALTSPSVVNWKASALFSLIFLTFNVRFINGNYDHIRSPDWADRRLGNTTIAYLIDVCVIILLHAILVVMASRCFITKGHVTLGQEIEKWDNYFCPGFFACLLLLVAVDVVWLFCKWAVHLSFEKTRISPAGSIASRYLHPLVRLFAGAYGQRNTVWLISNIAACIILILGARLIPSTEFGLANRPFSSLLERITSDNVYVLAGSGTWLWVLACLALLAAIYDLGSTSVGGRAERDLDRLHNLGTLFCEAQRLAKDVQASFTQQRHTSPTYQGTIPILWGVLVRGEMKFINATTPAGAESLVDAFNRYAQDNADAILKEKRIVLFCMLKPKNSDVSGIRAAMQRTAEANGHRGKPHIEVCWLSSYRREMREWPLEPCEGVTAIEVSASDLTHDPEFLDQLTKCMQDVDAAISEVSLSGSLAIL